MTDEPKKPQLNEKLELDEDFDAQKRKVDDWEEDVNDERGDLEERSSDDS